MSIEIHRYFEIVDDLVNVYHLLLPGVPLTYL